MTAGDQQHDARALRSAETTLSSVQRCADASQAGQITPAEAVEQILDELAARPSLGRVREALGRSFSPAQAH